MKKENLERRLKQIKAFVFDVDGVFTDSSIYFGENTPFRKYNIKDGYAITILKKLNFPMAIISGGKEESIKKRFNSLGIENVFINVPTNNKLEAFDSFIKEKNIEAKEVLYIGDDIADLLVMKSRPVFSCCPKDAVKEVKVQSQYVCKKKGGKGAVREIIELVLEAQKKWLIEF